MGNGLVSRLAVVCWLVLALQRLLLVVCCRPLMFCFWLAAAGHCGVIVLLIGAVYCWLGFWLVAIDCCG